MNDYAERTARFEFKRDDDNGMLIGPDGCHYDDEANAMYFGQIGLCGCGCPEDVHAFILQCLSATSDEYPNILDIEKIKKLIEQDIDVVAEFVAHFLNDRNLTEHGGSVYGSWLTERGKQVLEIGPMLDDESQ